MFAYLKQSTGSQSRLVGPFVDDTDFKTLETGLTIANTDVKLSKNGAAGANKNSGGGTHRNNGMYSLTFDATDSSAVGELTGSVSVSGALVVVFKFWVLEEAIYDSLFGASAAGFDSNQRMNVGSWLGTAVTTSGASSKPEVDMFSISNDATASNNAELFFDGTGYAGTNNVIPTVTTLTGHTVQTGDSFARIGTNGASLSALPWNSAWDAEVESEVVDGLKVTGLILHRATIATVTSQTEFIIPATDDATDDDAYNDGIAIFTDGSDANQKSFRKVTDYVASTRSVTIDAAPDFTITTSDTLTIIPMRGTTTSGTGGDTVTLTFTSSGDAIADADVWVNSAAGGPTVAGTLQTNSSGQVTLFLDAGVTYYVNMQKDGQNPIIDESFVAAAD